jgi:single-stranded-DNA-specific exonuclease
MLRYIQTSAGNRTEEEYEARAYALQKAAGISPVAARILARRGMDEASARAFLRDGFENLHDPFLLPGMEVSVKRILRAREKGERVTVFGDYDADGVCASVLLVHALRAGGFNAEFYLPSRHSEGYGLNKYALERLAQEGTDLLITVDCGITGVEEAAFARTLGLDIIITDHHQPLEHLPEAVACIAATLPYSRYPFAGLCGTGVAAKLVQALFGAEALRPYMGIVGLATVADLVPLLGENRIFVKEGLNALRTVPPVGIRALCDIAGVPHARLNAGHLGFLLGPRINAAGRMGDARAAAELLLCEDDQTAHDLAVQLEQDNARRRRLEQDIAQQALDMLQDIDIARARAVVLAGADWDHGVIGIVASRLVETLCVPVILFAREGEVLKGSGRSAPGVHLFNALREFSGLFDKFGGHEQAAGMTMPARNLPAFAKGFEELVRTRYEESLFTPSMRYDAAIEPFEVTDALARDLELFEPCGIGNPAPVLRLRGDGVRGVTLMGADKRHLRFSLPAPSGALECVAFGYGSRADELGEDIDLELLVTPQINRYNGTERVQCMVRHLGANTAFHEPEKAITRMTPNFADAIAAQILYNSNIRYTYANAGSGPEAGLHAVLKDRLERSARGTLILCNTPPGALGTLNAIKALGLEDRVQVARGAVGENPALFNTLLLAPADPAKACRHFKNVLVMDVLPFPDAVPDDVSQWWACGVEESADFIARCAFGRNELLTIYALLRRTLARRAAWQDTGALAAALKVPGRTPAQLMLALRIFAELGLLSERETDGRQTEYVVPARAERTQLEKSETYNRMRAYAQALAQEMQAGS